MTLLIPALVWTDITTVAIVGFLSNDTNHDVQYLESATAPDNNDATISGHLLNPGEGFSFDLDPGQKLFFKPAIAVGNGRLVITPNASFANDSGQEVVIAGPVTAFGEVSVAEKTPQVQIAAQYGLLEKMREVVNNGGNCLAEGSLFKCNTSTNALGFASLLSRDFLTYRPGQGAEGEFTAVFDTGTENSIQAAGLINPGDAFAFGFNGTSFGILRRFFGFQYCSELQVTTAASGAEVATVTIDGTGYSVSLTGGLTVQDDAREIAISLNTQVPVWNFTANNDKVILLSEGAQVFSGAFTFSSATAVASFTIIQVGVSPTDDWIEQANWNKNKFPNLDPTKGSPYKIQIEFLGFGGIDFFIEDSETANYQLVHRIQYANGSTTPSVGNPTFRIGWLIANFGNTSDLQITGASAQGAVEGKIVIKEPARSASNFVTGVDDTLISLISLRNRMAFGERGNLIVIKPISIILTVTAATQPVLIDVSLNAIVDDQVFQYVDESVSVAEVDTSGVDVTNGRKLPSASIVAGSPFEIDLEKLNTELLPLDMLTVAGAKTGGVNAQIAVVVNWQEDIT